MNKRFFAFGCSFTNYHWPTWADILNYEKKFIDYQNWGIPGASNKFIYNSIIESHMRNKISKDDIVIVMWSQYYRDVFYNDVENEWQPSERFFKNDSAGANNYHIHKAKTASDKATLTDDLSLIYSADLILSSIGCKYYFLSMVDLENLNYKKNKKIYKNYNFLLKKVKPSVFKTLYKNNWNNKKNKVYKNQEQINRRTEYYKNSEYTIFKNAYESVAGCDWPDFDNYYNNKVENISKEILKEIDAFSKKYNWKSYKMKDIDHFYFDLHPTPLEHLDYMNKILTDIDISKETRKWVENIDKKVLNKENIDDLWVNNKVKRW